MESNGKGFGFGFNDVRFSDRTIQLHIIPDPVNQTLATSSRTHKRHRLPAAVDQGIENSSSKECSAKTKTIYITTLILAAKSLFFYKMFTNGMVESTRRDITLQIQESEETTFMDLLKFMYTNTLTNTTPLALLNVLKAADKYEVVSCIEYCIQLLQKLPMTCDLALLYLDLPPTISMADTIQPFVDAGKKFLVERFKDIRKSSKEMLTLPLVGIKAILLSDDLQVDSEDLIFDFVMKWAVAHYKTKDERREIITKHLLHLIRFPFMSYRKLENVLTCTDINLELSSKLVFNALSFKIPHVHMSCLPPERVYNLRPVNVIRFSSPHEECVVYLDLKHEECTRLFPSTGIFSQPFDLRGQEFQLIANRGAGQHSLVHGFGIYLCAIGRASLDVEFKFSSRRKPSEEFVRSRCMLVYNFTGKDRYGEPNLFDVPWDTFIAEDSPYFINGVLHIRAVIKIKNQ